MLVGTWEIHKVEVSTSFVLRLKRHLHLSIVNTTGTLLSVYIYSSAPPVLAVYF